ncbi:MAG: S-adenosylmethionine decarboxylase [Candidatus Thalassarchaeaceae archaeon]|jgi:S-adenosylmethionine decarboxylase|nr:S-adenosylmethionine decarboxylase [Candidatus Thalassarchaeaceae archaeon]
MKAKGRHITLDYAGFSGNGGWVLSILRNAVSNSEAREVHSHVSEFDGSESPLGFAAVVLIDESHVSAHCYADDEILAVDCFTCGEINPASIIDQIHSQLSKHIPTLHLVQRQEWDRFIIE